MNESTREMGVGSLVLFFVLTFAFTWSLCAAMILFREEIEAATGRPMGYYNPVFILAVWGPAIVAFTLISLRYGLKGLGNYLRRLTLWRMHWGWWAFLIFGVPATRYFGAALDGGVGPFPFSPWYDVIPALFMAMIIGPVEEFGWRGFALPLLQRKMAPFWATLILGAIWGIWHFPAFIIEGTRQAENVNSGGISPFLIPGLALGLAVFSLPFTAMYNASRGSLLMPVLFHFQLNNDAYPDGGSGTMLAMLLFAVIIVWVTRDKMFRRDGGETELLMTSSSQPRLTTAQNN